MDRSAPPPTLLEIVVHATRPALVLVALGVLLLMPRVPFDPAPWLPAVGHAVVALAAALATATALALGLRHAGGALPAAAALGALGVGHGVAAVHALGALPALPPSEAEAAAATGELIAAGLLAVAIGVGARSGRRVRLARRVAAAIGLFVAIELALAASLLLPGVVPAALLPEAARGLATAIFAASGIGALLAGARLPGSWVLRPPALAEAALLLAAGTGSLALARPESLDAAPGLAALAIGALAAAFGLRPRAASRTGRLAADGSSAPRAGLPLEAGAEAATRGEGPDDASRLARELRGTIDELAGVRQTNDRLRAELERAIRVDELTGLANRRAILERLGLEVAEAQRYNHPVAALVLDVDGLAAANDNGWDGGDAVLREVALRFRLRVRAADGIGRLGEDTFLAVLPHTDEEGARLFGETLRRRIAERPVATHAAALEVHVAVGIATLRPGVEMAPAELLALAEEALREAQQAGGDRVVMSRLARLPRRSREGGDEGSTVQDNGA